MKQQTLNRAFVVEGKGLHTGRWIRASFLPADPDTGIRLSRVDLPGKPTCEASARYVTATNRSTVLEHGTWRVSTVEHALSALYAMGITNCLIELDGPEMPILDGSAERFVEEIMKAGIQQQAAEAKTWVVPETIRFDNGKGSVILITPADDYEVKAVVDFPSTIVGRQEAEIKDLTTYPTEIAPARTFCFLKEILPLLFIGLIRGGRLNNALVIGRHKFLSPLRFSNEPARHKLLDVIGDLSLIGCRIKGHIYIERPGHGFNTMVAKSLIERITQ